MLDQPGENERRADSNGTSLCTIREEKEKDYAEKKMKEVE